jgi:hypothetical protein
MVTMNLNTGTKDYISNTDLARILDTGIMMDIRFEFHYRVDFRTGVRCFIWECTERL